MLREKNNENFEEKVTMEEREEKVKQDEQAHFLDG